MSAMREWIVTFFGAGKSPVAPGTAGSLATSAVLCLLFHAFHTPVSFNLTLIVLMLLASAAAVMLGPWAIGHFGRKDPGPFVLDEVAGVCLTMLFLPVRAGLPELWVVLTAFVAFRIFDVWKPPPCHQLESLPQGWGILMDDLMAAVYANLLSQLVTRYLLG
jgi:phosphatidylglycerophosphatase A